MQCVFSVALGTRSDEKSLESKMLLLYLPSQEKIVKGRQTEEKKDSID